MGKAYAATGQGSAGTNKTMLGVTASASVRPRVFYLAAGSGGAPADQAGIFEVKRYTAAGTATSVTPQALDSAEVAAVAPAGENHSAEPTYTAGSELIAFGMNQRDKVQWWAYNDEAKIVLPATAASGLGFKSLSHSAPPTVDATFHWNE